MRIAAADALRNVCENGGCFVAGTPVEMADGTTKPIEHIKVGDVVKSRDLQTGRDEDESIVQTYEHPAAQVMSVSLADGESFTCTPDHRLIVAGKGIEPAGDLATGDKLFFGTAGTNTAAPSTTSVVRVTFKPEATTVLGDTEVYNFEVANTHTYFVGKINGGVWVHNDCIGWSIADGLRRAKAAELLGRDLVPAVELGNEGATPFNVSLSDLFSPYRDSIDLEGAGMDRWQNVYSGMASGEELPPIVLERGGRGLPIGEVQFSYGDD
jgi:hypothetical protein